MEPARLPATRGGLGPLGRVALGTLADRPERHRTRRSEPRPKPASKRPRGKPVTRRAAPCSAPAATPPEGRYRPRRGRPVPRARDRLGPWPPSRRRRPGKNKDVALTTQLSVPTAGAPDGRADRRSRTPTPEGGFGPRSEQPAPTGADVREGTQTRRAPRSFRRFRVAGYDNRRFSLSSNNNVKVKGNFLCIESQYAHIIST